MLEKEIEIEVENKTEILTFRVPKSLKLTLREKYGSSGELSKKFLNYAIKLAEN